MAVISNICGESDPKHTAPLNEARARKKPTEIKQLSSSSIILLNHNQLLFLMARWQLPRHFTIPLFLSSFSFTLSVELTVVPRPPRCRFSASHLSYEFFSPSVSHCFRLIVAEIPVSISLPRLAYRNHNLNWVRRVKTRKIISIDDRLVSFDFYVFCICVRA